MEQGISSTTPQNLNALALPSYSFFSFLQKEMLTLQSILKNKTGMTDTGTYYLPFGKHNLLTPLQDVVTPLRASVTPLQDVVTSLRGAVTPLQDVVTSLRGVVTPLRGAVTSLKDAVTPLRGAVTSPENTDILVIIPKNRIL
jgi:hypothetical protein